MPFKTRPWRSKWDRAVENVTVLFKTGRMITLCIPSQDVILYLIYMILFHLNGEKTLLLFIMFVLYTVLFGNTFVRVNVNMSQIKMSVLTFHLLNN